MRSRFLQSSSSSDPLQVDSDVVVILVALLCALISLVGLAFVARCAWIRRSVSPLSTPEVNKGIKKKVLESLPKQPFEAGGRLSECPICLDDFAANNEIRVLPQCGHGFHAACIDKWLTSHSSCPSCRQIILLPSRCRRCGATEDHFDHGVLP